MQKIKKIILISIILGCLAFIFSLEVVPENINSEEILGKAKNSDIIIIFNSGGWGNTPLEKAEDFAPIIAGIQETLSNLGYNSVVVPYKRTRDKIAGAKDFLSSFDYSSEILAKDLEFLTEKLPDKKIIITGLSNGAAFVNKTYGKISDKTKNSIYAIGAGAPFWSDSFVSDNILQLNNKEKDTLVRGNIIPLLSSLIKAPFEWISGKINGENLTFSQAFQLSHHEYYWNSPEVGPVIVSFLEAKIK